jgi:16S rRNA (cytidine1402-2'-O)-methyltransferase
MSADNPPVRPDTHGRLLVCATPIGNLDDVTLRVLQALREADVVACEDTRRTQILLERHDIQTTRLVSLHEHNERARADELAARVRAGETVALVSDAGTPLISDPGFALVRACVQEELTVEVLPGPSAVLTALIVSGLPVARWRFVGFLPRKRAELQGLLAGLEETTIAFESPRRLAATLSLLAGFDPDRPVTVCRELTKLHEEICRGTAAELAVHYEAHAPRGEIVLAIAAAAPGSERRDRALDALRELVGVGAHPRRAAAVVAKLTETGANEIYRELMRSGQQPERTRE